MKRVFGFIVLILIAQSLISQNVGINTITPSQKLDVNGKLKIGDDGNTPEAGTVRWNTANNDFEGYDGSNWRSLTKNNISSWGFSNNFEKENNKIVANDGTASDRFGCSVSISGDYIIIGSHNDNIGNNNGQGSAYVFKRSGSNWVQQAKLTASDGGLGDMFGFSVSISGDYAIVGSPSDDIGANYSQGSAYVFLRNGTTWSQQTKITVATGSAYDALGHSVSINGEYAAIGVVSDDIGSALNVGSAYIFKRDGTTWTQQSMLLASDGTEEDYFGQSISISGDYAIVGAGSADVSGNAYQGAAYIFKRNGTTWSQLNKLTAIDGAGLDYFGESVSISNDYAVVGAPSSNIGNNADQGAAYIYFRIGNDWTHQAKLTAFDGALQDRFGQSVSISNDYVIIGAPYDDVLNNFDQGSAYIFKRNSTNWILQTKISSSDGDLQDYFGKSVVISNNYAVAGAEYHNAAGNVDQGGAYIYNKNQ